jgi:hypothetical protein
MVGAMSEDTEPVEEQSREADIIAADSGLLSEAAIADAARANEMFEKVEKEAQAWHTSMTRAVEQNPGLFGEIDRLGIAASQAIMPDISAASKAITSDMNAAASKAIMPDFSAFRAVQAARINLPSPITSQGVARVPNLPSIPVDKLEALEDPGRAAATRTARNTEDMAYWLTQLGQVTVAMSTTQALERQEATGFRKTQKRYMVASFVLLVVATFIALAAFLGYGISRSDTPVSVTVPTSVTTTSTP